MLFVQFKIKYPKVPFSVEVTVYPFKKQVNTLDFVFWNKVHSRVLK